MRGIREREGDYQFFSYQHLRDFHAKPRRLPTLSTDRRQLGGRKGINISLGINCNFTSSCSEGLKPSFGFEFLYLRAMIRLHSKMIRLSYFGLS